MKTLYEWDIELWIEYEDGEIEYDILDHDHSDKCPSRVLESDEHLVLVREEWETFEGEPVDLADRSWAYVKEGKLPETFENGERVPQRFHKELLRRRES